MQSSMLRHITEDFGNGGTIDGDLTISGDLTVSGGGSLSFDEIIEGTSVIDVTDTEAFLVRKNGDGGDVFIVDTTNSRVGINKTSPDEKLHVAGNVKLFEAGNTADKTYSSTGAGLFLTSYQSDSGSPYTKTTDIVAGSDGTTPSEIRFFTRAVGSGNLGNPVTIGSGQNTTFNGSIKILDTSAPSIRLNPDASDATDNDRAFIGYATADDNFITGTVDNDLAIRS